jgi:hypothetical protein
MSKLNVKDSQFLLGATVAAGATPSAPSTAIAQVRDGNVTLGAVSMVETTTITDAAKTMTAGTRDTMGGSITIAWDPALATHGTLMTTFLAKTRTTIGFKIRDNEATPGDVVSYYGAGYITDVSAPIASKGGDALMECTVTFKLAEKFYKV